MKKPLLIFLLYATVPYTLLAQPNQRQELIDSLLIILKDIKEKTNTNVPTMNDTVTVNILYQLSKAYWYDNPEMAINYGGQSLTLSEKIGFKKGIGFAYYSMGVGNVWKEDYLVAMDLTKRSLKIGEEIGDKQIIASSYVNMGVVYHHQNIFPEALKNYYSALKIAEEISDKQIMIWIYLNMRHIYYSLENYTEALKNSFASLKIDLEIGDKEAIASDYTNIGLNFVELGKYSEALKHHFLALKIWEEIKNKSGVSNSYVNIGYTYQHQGNYHEALKYYFMHLKICEEFADTIRIGGAYDMIGQTYSKQKKYNEASHYLNKGLNIAKEFENLMAMQSDYQFLSEIYSAQAASPLNTIQKRGEYAILSLKHYKLFISSRDSLFNNENTKKITQVEMQYEFDKKESLAKAEQEKKEALTLKEIQKQKLVRNGFVGGFTVVLLFAGVFFTQRNKIKKGKRRSDELLLNILPGEVAEELKLKGSAEAKQFDEVTVMFTDFKDFTQISEKLSPSELVAEIHICFKAFDNLTGKYNIEKIKTIGDSYMCAGGLPVINKTNATDVVSAAMEIQQFMEEHSRKRRDEGKEPFEIRIGIHTGPVVAGIVGIKKFAYDIWGDTVNIASRMESSGEAGKVNISGSTYELVKGKFTCNYRGKVLAKHKGETDMYFVEGISYQE